MSFFSSLRRWWQRNGTLEQKTSQQRRWLLGFDTLEARTLPDATPFAIPTGFTPDSAIQGDNLTNQARITLQGQGTPGTPFNLYSNNAALGKSVVGADGTWSFNVAKTLGNTTYVFKTQPTDNPDPVAGGALTVTVDRVKPKVTLTPVAYQLGSPAQVTVMAVDANGLQQVAIDVDTNGNGKFEVDEMDLAVGTLTSGQPTTIDLGSFPNFPTVKLRARALDLAGNEGASRVVAMKGPQLNKVTLKVPKVTDDSVYVATVQATAGLNNGFQSTFFIDVDLNKNGQFETTEEMASGTLNSTGGGTASLTSLVAGTYKLRARITDLGGKEAVSTKQTMRVLVSAPTDLASLAFVPNLGQVHVSANQADPNVKFTVRNQNGPPAYLSPNLLTMQAPYLDTEGNKGWMAQRMVLVNGSAAAQGVGQKRLASNSSFYVRGLALTDVPHYGQVEFDNVYANIDVRYRGTGGTLAYDFIVQPGGNVNDIVLSFPDAVGISLNGTGQLVIDLGGGQTIVQDRPLTFQHGTGGVVQAVPSDFVVSNGQVGFQVGSYDAARPLIIDPYIFTHFLTSDGPDFIGGIAQDPRGNIYMVGTSAGANYPEIPAPAVTNDQTGNDVVVTRFTSSGTIAYSVYIGGDLADQGNGIAVDSAGFAYITGQTTSVFGGAGAVPYPTSFNTFAPNSFLPEAFVTILNPNGTIFQSTFLGSSSLIVTDSGVSIALDGQENIWVAGNSTGANTFPAPVFTLGTQRMFVTKFNRRDLTATTGYQHTWAIGGGIFSDTVSSLMIDALDRIYLVGTSQNSFAAAFLTANAYQSTGSIFDKGFLIRLIEAPTGTFILDYGTFLGGDITGLPAPPSSTANAVAVDTNFDIYVAGTTNSNDFFNPALTSGLQTSRLPSQNDDDAFFIKLRVDPLITTAVAGTYFGTAFQDDEGVDIAVDTAKNVYLYGQADKAAAAVTAPAIFNVNRVQPYIAGSDTDVFVTILNPTATGQLLGALMGGQGDETVTSFGNARNGMVVDPLGNIYFAGNTTDTPDFQTVVQNAGGASAIFGGTPTAGAPSDIFVGKIRRVGSRNLGSDDLEPNDTSEKAKSIDGFINGNPVPNLTTAKKSNGLFDYDWYKVRPPTNGVLTVSLTNIFVFASGPRETLLTGGDLHLFIYRRRQGFLYLADRSTIANSGFQRVSINVEAGEDIVILVNPFNFTQAFYTMNIDLV